MGTAPFLAFIEANVYDTGGNNNGILDPGETIDLTATLRNVGGVDFTDLATTLECSDPNIDVLDNYGYFGNLEIDSTRENVGDPYVISANASTPQGHTAEFLLVSTEGSYVDTFTFDLIVGGIDYLIWNPDITPISGEMINIVLTNLGYSGNHSATLPSSDINIYKAIYVCLGVYPHNYFVAATSPEATALVNYLNGGGCMYIEGGEVWYYDPTVGGYNFAPMFGIDPFSDGTGNLGPIIGQPGTFTDGMFFYYAGENYSMDQINPIGGDASLIFSDYDNGYGCGVANDLSNYQTVGTSFELGCLVDGGGASTRAALLDSIMHFFGVLPTGTAEVTNFDVVTPKLWIYPNPSSNRINIRHSTGQSAALIDLKVYDATGSLVEQFDHATVSQSDQFSWAGTDNRGLRLPAGIYFVCLEVDDHREVAKLILVE